MKRLFFILLIVPLVLISGCSDKHQDDRLKVIFETDIGNDVDDALALDMLYKYVEWGQVDLLAVMINKDAPAPAEYMDIMNTWYGHTDIPVGIVRDGSDDPWGQYAQKVVDLKNEDGTPMFARSRESYDDLPDAHILYRQILAKQPDASVVIATVGFSTNLARLLDTPADEYSPLTGKELVAKKVKLLSAMAGNISELEHHEYNVVKDLPAAIKVFAEWPTEIVVSPFEVGRAIKYPGESIENDFTWAPKHPMVEAYKAYLPMPYDRPTWDLTSVLYAVEGDSWFTMSEPGRIEITSEGSSVFTPCPDGNVRYMKVDDAQCAAILGRFKEVITSQPKARQQPVR
jgi:inosine-uridine nucleoside N-ribohydrolase